MITTTTKRELIIMELVTPFSYIEVQYVPAEINVPREAHMQNVTIVGRNDELMHYISGSERMSLTLDFHADDVNKDEVYKKVNWLKSLTANDGYAGKFRNVKIVWGDMFKNQVWAIQGVNPKYSHFSADNKWMPLRCSVQINLKLDPKKNRYIKDIRNGN